MAVSLWVAVAIFTGVNALAANTYTVTTLGDTTGSCSGGSCTTLRAAIETANGSAGNTINFTGLSSTITLTSALPAITQSMTITGPGASTLTISGNSAYQILNVSSGTASISGLTFANGMTAFANATTTTGSGGAIENSGTLMVTNTAFLGNSADYFGGAIENNNGTLTVTSSTFSGNSASSNGGSIYSNGSLTVINSTFSVNSGGFEAAGGAGAIFNSGTLALVNNTFTGNSGNYGGAIYNSGSSVTADNNIFVGNSSQDGSGAGILDYSHTVNAGYNLFYQNVDAGGTEDDCNSCGSNTNAITGSNPNLLPLGYYGGPTETLLPQPGSSAICAGSYADFPSGVTTDQRGFPLTNSTCSNGGVDVGSVQSNYVQVTNTNDSGAGSLRAAIAAAGATHTGGDIAFAPNVTGTITLASALPTISQSLVIMGPGASNLTVSGNSEYQIFSISSGTVTISGLSLANGSGLLATNGGGGAINNAGVLTVANTTFSANTTAAIFNSGPLTVTDSTFSGNSGDYGGAISSYGAMTVTNCTFSGNTAVNGGGAITSNITLDVTNSTFSGNSTTDAIAANGAFGGGAILSFGTNLTVTTSTFSGNSSAAWGGAIYAYGSFSPTFTASSNIFVGNTVSNSYGGAGITAFVGTSNANYNLFYQNLNASGAETDCDGCTSNTNAITGSDPHLAALSNYGGLTQTMLPEPGSPAICSGATGLIPSGVTTDQRGFSRTTSYTGIACVDLGAVQTDYTAVALSGSSYSVLVNEDVNPAPVVTVTESGQNIGGIPITLGYSGTGTPTGLGPVTTVGGAGATFSSLTASSAAEGTLTVNLPITASNNPVQPAALTASASLNIYLPPQAITFVAAPAVTYGQAPITLMATGGASGNPVTFSLDTTSAPGAAKLSGSTLTILGVGTIVIDANQAGNSNYQAAPQVQQSIMVNPSSLTITASSPTVTYGSAVATITPIFGAFFNGDTSAVLTKQPMCVTAYTTSSAVGSLPSTSCSGASAANYTFTYVNGSVTVNAAPLTITASSSTVTYGSAIPTIKPIFGAFFNGDTSAVLTKQPTCVTAYTTTSAVGSSPSTSCSGAGAANYIFTYVSGSVTVNPASLAITASSPTVTYGSAIPAITPIFGAFFNGDTSAVLTKQPACSTTYTTTSAAGSSPSTSCLGAAAANYIFTYVNRSVTVNPAPTFVVGGGSASISIAPGATTGNTVPITVTPSNGFTGTVNLTCSISPVAASDSPTCSLSPVSVTITGTGAQTSALTVSTTASTVGENQLTPLWPPAGALALVLMIGVSRRRRRGWLTMLGALAISMVLGAAGCGSGGGGGSSAGNSGTTPGTYSITVAGASGSVTGTVGTVTLTVQ